MPLPKSREWLDRLLEGHEPTDAELRQLVQDCPHEDQWIEYKAGAKLREPEPAAFLREYIAGFANADGGALVAGCREDRTFDGAQAPGGGRLKDWASRALTPIRTGSTLPPPRFAVTPIDGVDVLIVSVGRARMPVADIRSRVPVFFVRMGDQTLETPHWLVTDLLLGRRARAELRVTSVQVIGARPVQVPGGVRASAMDLTLRINHENDALILAEIARCGVVSWSVQPQRDLPQQLRRAIDLVTPPEDQLLGGYQWRWHVSHSQSSVRDRLEPFAHGVADIVYERLPVFDPVAPPRPDATPDVRAQARGALEVKAALYLIAKDAEPSWWQLILRYDSIAREQLTQRSARHVRFEPCFYSRPVVSLRFLDEGEPVEFPAP